MKRKSEYYNDHIEKRQYIKGAVKVACALSTVGDKVACKRNVNYQCYKPFKKIVLSVIANEFIRYADDGIV